MHSNFFRIFLHLLKYGLRKKKKKWNYSIARKITSVVCYENCYVLQKLCEILNIPFMFQIFVKVKIKKIHMDTKKINEFISNENKENLSIYWRYFYHIC